MKQRIHYIAVLALAALVVSCDLKEDGSVITSPDDFYQNAAQIRAGLNSCYGPLNDIYVLGYMIAVEGTTDLAATKYSAQKDAMLEISPSSSGCGTRVWQYGYNGVRRCADVIRGINRSPLSAEERLPYLMEAKDMLAYYYYMLTSFFGGVPFWEEAIVTTDDLERVGHLGRTDATEIRSTLIKELQELAPMVPQQRTSDVEGNYMGSAMAWMLIAKMAAWNKDWDSVIEACLRLQDIYGDLSQYPYSDVMFRNKNTPESIFEIQHAWSPSGIQYITPGSLAVATVCMPYPHTGGSTLYDGVDIPELGTMATAYRPLIPSDWFKSVVMPTGQGDLRRDYLMVRSWNGTSFGGSRTWMGPKFWCPDMVGNQDGNNYKVFRYADALLLLAEAYCEKGFYSQSIRALDEVRERAGLPGYGAFQSQVKLRGEIRNERARELFGEFGRKFDLVRWGIWYEQVVAYNTYEKLQQYIRPCHEYYPIPDVQVLSSGGALDNPEYKKYGIGE